MAKRKRLTPPRSTFLETEPSDLKGPVPPIAQVVSDVAETAGFHELAAAMETARKEGRLLLNVALSEVDAGYLVRDRLMADEDELTVLCTSLEARGQQTAIEVVDLGADRAGGRYGLISGWRRLTALRRLQSRAEPGKFDTVLARITQPTDASDTYLAMVEENEIRVGLSYYERARIVVKSVEAGVYETERAALTHLYSAASRAKRSKIKSFVALVQELDTALAFPATLGERLGLEVARRLAEDPTYKDQISQQLRAENPQDSEQEQALIKSSLKAETGSKPAVKTPPEAVPISRDVTVQFSPGSLELKGKGVTPELRDALQAWLAAQLR